MVSAAMRSTPSSSSSTSPIFTSAPASVCDREAVCVDRRLNGRSRRSEAQKDAELLKAVQRRSRRFQAGPSVWEMHATAERLFPLTETRSARQHLECSAARMQAAPEDVLASAVASMVRLKPARRRSRAGRGRHRRHRRHRFRPSRARRRNGARIQLGRRHGASRLPLLPGRASSQGTGHVSAG
jgi:hypothetical protein